MRTRISTDTVPGEEGREKEVDVPQVRWASPVCSVLVGQAVTPLARAFNLVIGLVSRLLRSRVSETPTRYQVHIRGARNMAVNDQIW